MMFFTRQLILILLSQMLCSTVATDDVSPPIRKRTQHRVLRGSSTRETDFDPFIGIEVARELSSESIQKSTEHSMSLSTLSMPTKSTPPDETSMPRTFSPATPTANPTTYTPTSVTVIDGDGSFLDDGDENIHLEDESTEMPVRFWKPTLLPTTFNQLI